METYKLVYLMTTDGQYFMLRNIPDDKLSLEIAGMQNGAKPAFTGTLVELHRKETQLAIVFTRDSKRFLLITVRKESQVNLELKELTNKTVQQNDYYFKCKDLKAGDSYGLSTVAEPQTYISISEESVAGITSEVTLCVHVTEEVASSSPT